MAINRFPTSMVPAQLSGPTDYNQIIQALTSDTANTRRGALSALGSSDFNRLGLRKAILQQSGLTGQDVRQSPEVQNQLRQLMGATREGMTGGFEGLLKGFQSTAPAMLAQQTRLQPYEAAGETALQRQLDLLGLNGYKAMNEAYMESPAQKFARQQQEKALIRNRAVTGGLGDEGVSEALARLTSGLTNQNIQGQLNQLGALSGRGYNAASTIGQVGASGLVDQQRILSAADQARSARNAEGSGLGGVLQNAGMVANALSMVPGAHSGFKTLANLIPKQGTDRIALNPQNVVNEGRAYANMSNQQIEDTLYGY